MVDCDGLETEKRLKSVLDELANDCNRYTSLTRNAGSGPGTGKTKLDKERSKMCLREIVRAYLFNINYYQKCMKYYFTRLPVWFLKSRAKLSRRY